MSGVTVLWMDISMFSIPNYCIQKRQEVCVMDHYAPTEQLVEVFLFETSQLLDQLEQSILAGERDTQFTPEQVDGIMRTMHTIKGSSAVMMLDNVARLSHSIEDLYSYISREQPCISDCSGLTDIVLAGCDFIKLELLKVQNRHPADGDERELLGRSGMYLERLKEQAGNGREAGRPAAMEAAESTGEIITDQAEPPEALRLYKARIFFYEDCLMENVRAYALWNRLREIAAQVVSEPADLTSNSKAEEVIRHDGLTLWLYAECPKEVLERALEQTAFLREWTLEAWNRGEEEPPEGEFPQGELHGQPENGRMPPAQTVSSLAVQGKDTVSFRQNLISVQVDKLDKLMDLVGELVISEAMVKECGSRDQQADFVKATGHLRKIIGEIQDMVMSIRMVPLVNTFQKMKRIVRDMSKKMGKHIKLELGGEDTEVDKSIIEHISDPLMHLIRNAADHGIELPEEREARSKPAAGTIRLTASNVGSEVQIQLKDDGRGLNRKRILEKAQENGLLAKPAEDMTDDEVFSLIFLPGFSTKKDVTEYSGRGVGMDVVLRNVEEIGGSITVTSREGEGTTFIMRLPLTLSIIDGMNIRVGQSRYTLPITAIRESFRVHEKDVIHDLDGNEMLLVRGECYPVLRLHRRFHVCQAVTRISEGIMIMVQNERKACCLFADELLGEQQVVVKTMPEYLRRISTGKGISGCTLLGDGSISLILDMSTLIP